MGGGGACELPPRAGPAAAKHFLKLQQQQLSFLQTSRLGHRQQQHLARGRAWRGVATGGDPHHHGDHDLHHRWAPQRAPAVRGRAPATGPSHHHHLSHTFPSWSDETEERRLVEEEGSQTKKTWSQKKEDPKERVSSCPGPLSFT